MSQHESSHNVYSLSAIQDSTEIRPQNRIDNGATSSAKTNSTDTATNLTSRRKTGRKGHTKSRAGCMNCKRARIKCKENKPICDYCLHRDLQCVWPETHVAPKQRTSVQSNSSAPVDFLISSSSSSLDGSVTPASSLALTSSPAHTMPVFSMQDFRLFNFFIQKGYPHHPIGNDKIWRHEIPCLASDYDFLLHSMLALSASELQDSQEEKSEMYSTALAHRVKAISSLNAAVARGIQSYEEGNAMLATCFSLLFQSCLLEDGLMEYMMFIRGTVSIGWSMGTRRMKFVFEKLFDNEQLEQVDPAMHAAPLIHPDVAASACRSFEKFKHLCQNKVEVDVYVILSSIASSLTTSSRDAYMALRKMYELFSYTMPQSEFEQYCDASSVVCQLLQAHFTALQLIMAPVTKSEMQYKEAEVGKLRENNGATVLWLVGIHRRVPDEWRKYFSWTLWVQDEVRSGRLFNGRVRDEENPGTLHELMGDFNSEWDTVTSAS